MIKHLPGPSQSAVPVCRCMNGFSTNKTTVLLDFKPLGSHSAAAVL